MAGRQRVLIYRLGSLGDTVVALPAFRLIAQAFHTSERRLLTNFPVASKAPPAAAILEGTGLVHGYFRYSAGTRSWRELVRLWSRIVAWRPDVLVYVGPARGVESAQRDARFFRLCGIRQLIGVPLTEDMQRNRLHFDPDLGYDTEEYEAQRLVRNLDQLGTISLDDPASWDLCLTAAEHDRAITALQPAGERPFIAISLGTKVQANHWEEPNWRTLLGRIAESYPEHSLVLVGADSDRDASDRVSEPWRVRSHSRLSGPVLNLCGQLTPRQSAAVFSRAAAYIGHDSGPMHLAAAAGTTCIAIFSARGLPRRWFPYGRAHKVLYHRVSCWGCGLDTCILERKRCILSITVDEVLEQLATVLNAPQVAFPSHSPRSRNVSNGS